MTSTIFINQLSDDAQNNIINDLINLGLESEDIQNAMDSRLSDLSDVININQYL